MFAMVRNVLGNMPLRKPTSGSSEPASITRAQFLLALCNGLGCNLNLKDRVELTQQVFQWANENLPDPTNPLNISVDPLNPDRFCQITLGEDDVSLSDTSYDSV